MILCTYVRTYVFIVIPKLGVNPKSGKDLFEDTLRYVSIKKRKEQGEKKEDRGQQKTHKPQR